MWLTTGRWRVIAEIFGRDGSKVQTLGNHILSPLIVFFCFDHRHQLHPSPTLERIELKGRHQAAQHHGQNNADEQENFLLFLLSVVTVAIIRVEPVRRHRRVAVRHGPAISSRLVRQIGNRRNDLSPDQRRIMGGMSNVAATVRMLLPTSDPLRAPSGKFEWAQTLHSLIHSKSVFLVGRNRVDRKVSLTRAGRAGAPWLLEHLKDHALGRDLSIT